VVDSGIHAGHPHVGPVLDGANLVPGADAADFTDRLGHGTAVAAAIREKCPAAGLIAVRVFDRQLATSAHVLARAIETSVQRGARLINLSLGTSNAAHSELFGAAVDCAHEAGAIVVSARKSGDVRWFPGSLPLVAGVEVDWSLERNQLEILEDDAGVVFRASGYPRPIPGVPRERNLSGLSFAVANVTGFLARGMEARSWPAVIEIVSDLRT